MALAASATALAALAVTPPAAAATPGPTQVVITDAGCPSSPSCYAPSTVSIPVNGSVTWTNQSSSDHTVTCTSAPAGAGCNGDSGGSQPGRFGETSPIHHSGNGTTYTYQFTTPGTYTYHSKGDSASMVGEIDVQPSGPVTFAIGTPVPTSAPAATPTGTASPTASDVPSPSASLSPGSSPSGTASATDGGPSGVTPGSGGGGFPVIPVVLIILLAAGAAGGAVYLNRRR